MSRLGGRWIFVAILLAGPLLAGCGSPPSMGPDPDVFKTIDALYTAVGIKHVEQLERCDAKLRELHAAGKLPDDALRSLERIITRAKDGDWQTAADHLRWFMEGQRRR
jgi:hypothetical protein